MKLLCTLFYQQKYFMWEINKKKKKIIFKKHFNISTFQYSFNTSISISDNIWISFCFNFENWFEEKNEKNNVTVLL